MQVTYIGFGFPTVILKPIITLACLSNKHKAYICFNFAFYHLGWPYLLTLCIPFSLGYSVGIRSYIVLNYYVTWYYIE
jgi:hypothetical protein